MESDPICSICSAVPAPVVLAPDFCISALSGRPGRLRAVICLSSGCREAPPFHERGKMELIQSLDPSLSMAVLFFGVLAFSICLAVVNLLSDY
jgi:hypothetical protein